MADQAQSPVPGGETDDACPPCPTCGRESMYALAPEERRGQFVCEAHGYFTEADASEPTAATPDELTAAIEYKRRLLDLLAQRGAAIRALCDVAAHGTLDEVREMAARIQGSDGKPIPTPSSPEVGGERPCLICGKAKAYHAGPERFCGQYATYRPAPRTAIQEGGEENGCLCGKCGRRYRVDVQVPAALWTALAGDTELLCPRCIADGLEALGEFAAFRLVDVDSLASSTPVSAGRVWQQNYTDEGPPEGCSACEAGIPMQDGLHRIPEGSMYAGFLYRCDDTPVSAGREEPHWTEREEITEADVRLLREANGNMAQENFELRRLVAKLIDERLLSDGQFAALGHVITYTDDADLGAWTAEAAAQGQTAAEMFWDGDDAREDAVDFLLGVVRTSIPASEVPHD